MTKKRKLNSKNPKYWSAKKKEGPKIRKKILSCITPSKVEVYSIWYEN